MGSYSLISADSHINEPPDTFVERVPASMRERAPRVERIDGGDVWIFETGAPRAIGLDSMAGRKFQDYKRSGHSYEAMRAGAYDPRARVEDMDQDGVDAEVIYPGTGFRLASMEEPELRLACMRAYNDWLAEFCAEAPGRFVGLGLVPVQDVDAAAAEIERIAGRGLRGIVLPAQPALNYADAFYEPLWAAAEDHRFPISFHIGGVRGRTMTGGPGAVLSYMAMGKLALAEPVSMLIFGGVLERHPGLRMVLVEGGFGWLPYFITQMDTTFGRHQYWSGAKLPEDPSFYFRRQVQATFIEDRAGMAVIDLVGAGNIMWSSDYPHSDTTWPNSRQSVADQFEGVADDDRCKIVAGNAAALYGLG